MQSDKNALLYLNFEFRDTFSSGNSFFNCYLATPRPTLGYYRGGSLIHPMLVTAFLQFRPNGHRKPRNEVVSLSTAKGLVDFEQGTFRLCVQRLNPLGHSPQGEITKSQISLH